MLVDDADAVLLKKWVVKRLEDMYVARSNCVSGRQRLVPDALYSSDADSDVLADYVLALVRSEDPDEQVKSNCLENLEDFLRDRNVASSSFKCAALTLLI